MQIRCQQCQKPFGLTSESIQNALQAIEVEKLTHYDMYCPHCRKLNRVSAKEIQRLTRGVKLAVPKQDSPN